MVESNKPLPAPSSGSAQPGPASGPLQVLKQGQDSARRGSAPTLGPALPHSYWLQRNAHSGQTVCCQGTTYFSSEKGPGCPALGRNGVTPSPGLRHHWGEGGVC